MVAFYFLFSCEKNEQNNPVPDNFFPLWLKFKDCQMSIYRWWAVTMAMQEDDFVTWQKIAHLWWNTYIDKETRWSQSPLK